MKTIKRTRTIKKITLTVYTDPGHGWVKVDRSILKALGIEEQISHYSYQRNKACYLEEDCDAALLIKSLDARGVKVSFVEKNCRDRQSKIRGYDRYKKPSQVANDFNKFFGISTLSA